MLQDYAFSVAERFMRYVEIDTQSDPSSHDFPSTEKQKNLAELVSICAQKQMTGTSFLEVLAGMVA